VVATADTLRHLYVDTAQICSWIPDLDPEQIHLAIKESRVPAQVADRVADYSKVVTIKIKLSMVKLRPSKQALYITNILANYIAFGIGPAGGKTYLMVAAAIDALECQEIRRILLTCSAVKAGEKLGFLPG
jgi:phosphate starvation-inducible PhoH-like protein